MRRVLGSLLARAAALKVEAYRRGLLRQSRLSGAVVSVGNLSVGGNGKTPVVRRVAEILRAAGLPVAVLSRGYGGDFRGRVLFVSDGTTVAASAALAGDEPVMLARALPGVVVAVGRRRDAVGRAVEARFGPVAHVLDDGFQHLRLRRDLDVLCLDVADLDDRPLPQGRLREAPAALARADVVLLTRVDAASGPELEWLEERVGRERVHRVGRRLSGFRNLEGERAGPPRQAFVLAAIARPERLLHDLETAGVHVAESTLLRDHHRFDRRDLETAAARARASGAEAIVTTAKDAVRLENLPRPAMPVLVAETEAVIADEARFVARLLAAVERALPARVEPAP